MRFSIPLASATLLALSAPSFAGGLGEPTPEPMVVEQAAPMPYMGADWGGGYAGAQLGFGDVSTDGAASVEGDDILYGVHAGYRWDFGTTVIGAEAGYNVGEIDLSGGAGTIDDVLRLKLNAGYDMGSTLIYGTIGAAQASATLGGVERDDMGYLFGAGLAYDLGNSWEVGGEVLRHQFDDFDATGINVDVNTLTARLSYRF